MYPLAERLRPTKLEDFIGQEHILGEKAVLRKMLDSQNIQSLILWGPPGVGKTTLSKIIANKLARTFYTLSAVSSGVKDVRNVIAKAKKLQLFQKLNPILFIDEIHRFSKSQQDSLLHAVELGIITLIGATTENPSFEIISPLLSRCQVYILKSLEKKDLEILLTRAITTDEKLKKREIIIKEKEALFLHSGGDARKLLNIIEIIVDAEKTNNVFITNDIVNNILQKTTVRYDKNGEFHTFYIFLIMIIIFIHNGNLFLYFLHNSFN